MLGAVVLNSTNNQIRFQEGGSSYTATIPSGTYYLRGQSAKNLITHSYILTNWTLGSSDVVAKSQVEFSPTGGTSYFFETINNSFGSVSASLPVSFTGNGTKTCSFYVKQGTAAASDFSIYDSTLPATRHLIRLTWSSGVPSISTILGSGTATVSRKINNNWWKILFTADSVVAANTNLFVCHPSTYAAGPTGSVHLWGVTAKDSAAGDQYVPTTGTATTGPSDDLALALQTALNAVAPSNVYTVDVGAPNIDPSGTHSIITITRSSGANNFAILWGNNLTTFDERLLGFAGDTALTAGTKYSMFSCAAMWVASDLYRQLEPSSEKIVAVPRAASGRPQGLSRSSRMQNWNMGLSFIDERRMFVRKASTPADSLEGFMDRFGANASFEMHDLALLSGTNLQWTHNVDTLVAKMAFSESSLSEFAPVRLGPGVPLYSVDLLLHTKV